MPSTSRLTTFGSRHQSDWHARPSVPSDGMGQRHGTRSVHASAQDVAAAVRAQVALEFGGVRYGRAFLTASCLIVARLTLAQHRLSRTFEFRVSGIPGGTFPSRGIDAPRGIGAHRPYGPAPLPPTSAQTAATCRTRSNANSLQAPLRTPARWPIRQSRYRTSEHSVGGVPGPDARQHLGIGGDLGVTEAAIEMALMGQ